MAGELRATLMGDKTDKEIFSEIWEEQGFKGVRKEGGTVITAPMQRLLHDSNKDTLAKNKGMVKNAIVKQMTSTEVSGATPLVFDPEILNIEFMTAPFLEMLPQEGQQGYKAVYNRIDSRDDPIGFQAEGDVLDLSGYSGKDIGFTKGETDMKIYVDKANISDFSQAAAAHYMNVEDTTLGQRIALHAQWKEQMVFYGDTSQGTGSGWIGDSNGYDGMAKIFTDAGNVEDKSGVSSGEYVKDIRSEIYDLLQNQNIQATDLLIVTSYSMFDQLTRELVPAQTRYGATETTTDVGIQQLRINGVRVLATHNIKEYTDGDYNVGNEGDVFIVNTRAARFRALVPLSSVPLAKLGLSQATAIFEFGAFIDRAGGNWGKYLKNYTVTTS